MIGLDPIKKYIKYIFFIHKKTSELNQRFFIMVKFINYNEEECTKRSVNLFE